MKLWVPVSSETCEYQSNGVNGETTRAHQTPAKTTGFRQKTCKYLGESLTVTYINSLGPFTVLKKNPISLMNSCQATRDQQPVFSQRKQTVITSIILMFSAEACACPISTVEYLVLSTTLTLISMAEKVPELLQSQSRPSVTRFTLIYLPLQLDCVLTHSL